jgi:surface polysaccharide O-acyltransferase-like enzyme
MSAIESVTQNSSSLGEGHGLTPRAGWADLCRVVAIYGVILIHSCGATFYSFGKIPLSDWFAANALDSLARVSVPLFVMLSGAMLLKPGAPITALSSLPQRVSKVLIPLVVWSLLYLYVVASHKGAPIDWLGTLRQPAMYHLWFVYMIIGLYLLLPFLQAIFEAIRDKPALSLYFMAVWVVITCVPLYFPVPLLGIMQQTTFLGYGGYFILGGLLVTCLKDNIPTAIWIGLYLASSMVTFLLTWNFSDKVSAPTETAYVYFTLNVAIATLAAFKAFTRVKTGPTTGKILHWISDRSFLIFFVHVLVLEQVRYSAIIVSLSQLLPTFFVILIISVATFIFSLLIAALIRFIPGASRVAG